MRTTFGDALIVVAALITSVGHVGCNGARDEAKPDPSRASEQPGASAPDKSDGSTDGKPAEWSCPRDTKGAKMVLIPDTPKPFRIDHREATYGEYKEFMAAKGDDFGGQPPECESNKDYKPIEKIVSTDADPYTVPCSPPLAEAHPDHAVRCIDFCGATCKTHPRRDILAEEPPRRQDAKKIFRAISRQSMSFAIASVMHGPIVLGRGNGCAACVEPNLGKLL